VELTGFELLDPLVAIAVAMNILISGYRLVRLSIGGLMDESDIRTLDRIGEIVNAARTPEWIELHNLRVIRSGRLHHVDFHLTIPFYWSVERGHDFQQSVTKTISTGLSEQAQVLIHLDPCNPSFCKVCNVHPCPERRTPKTDSLEWTVTKMVGGPITDAD
jgi:divalent metal cation (Fe/Co/Zn/Cd) transporter